MKRAVLVGLAILCGSWILATLGARGLVVSDPVSADVIVVMAGAPVYLERVRHAAQVFRAGAATRILLTNDGQRGRWSRDVQRNPASVERAAMALESAGVPRHQIDILPGVVRGTIDEARAVRTYVRAHEVRTLLVVTSPYHSRRAVWTMRRVLQGEAISVGVVTVPATSTTPGAATWWLSRTGWRTVAFEFIKVPYYWLAYGPRAG